MQDKYIQYGAGAYDRLNHTTSMEDLKRLQLCERSCVTPFDPEKGYPPVALNGTGSHLVCNGVYRDMADYAHPSAPFRHDFQKEYHVKVQLESVAVQCLPVAPIIYVKFEGLGLFYKNMADKLIDGYILITADSDRTAPGEHRNTILKDNKLIMWFAINADIRHPKITKIPIGLNCFLHSRQLLVYQNMSEEYAKTHNGRKTLTWRKDKFLLVNFRGRTHPTRDRLIKQFCDRNLSFVQCISIPGGQMKTLPSGEMRINDAEVYWNFSQYPFWLAPRGNGLDTHRMFEAQYIGSIPVTQTGVLDEVYEDMRVLIVKSYDDITEKFLRDKLAGFENRTFSNQKLTRNYWWKKIEKTRHDYLVSHNLLSRAKNRRRCWQ